MGCLRPIPCFSLRSIIHTSFRFAYSCSVGLGTFFFKIHFLLGCTSFYLYKSLLVFLFLVLYPRASVFLVTPGKALFVW